MLRSSTRQSKLSRRARFLVTGLAATVALLASPSPASAAVTCTAESATGEMLITLNNDNDDVTIGRTAGSPGNFAITSTTTSPAAFEECNAMNLEQIDHVTVVTNEVLSPSGMQTVTIDERNGLFAPGASLEESAGAGEIEFSIDLGGGSDRLNIHGVDLTGSPDLADTIIGGSGEGGALPGFNINPQNEATDDVDIAHADVELFSIFGNSGDDTITLTGGSATGGAMATGASIAGGPGADTLTGSAGNDTFTEDASANGNDTFNGDGGTDTVSYASRPAAAPVQMSLNMTADDGDIATSEGDNILDSVENLTAGAGADVLQGNGSANVFSGGAGSDLVTYAGRTENLSLTLDGAANDGATGEGDQLSGDIERVTGGSGDDTITGSAVANVLAGGPGADAISGLAGADTVNGDDGDDVLSGGADNDTLNGGAHQDSLNGDAGDDIVNGGTGGDVLDGGDGIDTASYADRTVAVTLTAGDGANDGAAGEGDNILDTVENLEGGSGNDVITGGANNNTLTGNAGDDTIRGGGGIDTLKGGAGNDNLEGGAGNDSLDGGDGSDSLDASAEVGPYTVDLAAGTASSTAGGADTLAGIEHVFGSPQDDSLKGTAEANTLSGGGGNDRLEGRAGNDQLAGGTGDDTLLPGADEDLVNGGEGTDTLSFLGSPAVSVDLAAGTATGDGTDTIVTVAGISGVENVIGSSNGDIIRGDAGANFLDGAGGNDTVEGRAGNDVLDGGDQDDIDTLEYTSAPSGVRVSLNVDTAQSTGGAGIDTIVFATKTSGVPAETTSFSSFENLTGSAFNDELTGDTRNNTLRGLAGNDLVSGLAGDDLLSGGMGDDRISGGPSLTGDTADYSDAPAGVIVDLSLGQAEQDTIGAGRDTVVVAHLLGSAFDDTFFGNDSDNVLNGVAGNDLLQGGPGDDTLNGGPAEGTDTASFTRATGPVTIDMTPAAPATAEQISATEGTDEFVNIDNVIGSIFNDTISTDANPNVITPLAGDDTVDGDGGLDTISYANAGGPVTVSLATATPQATGEGSDTIANVENVLGSAFGDALTGSSGANVLMGALGNDKLAGLGGDDTLDGGEGSDEADYSAYTPPATTPATTTGVSVDLSNGAPQDTNNGTDTFVSIENLTGSSADDTLIGNDGANRISGGGGNDTLNGLAGDDQINGDDGDDTVLPGGGVDTSNGGAGTDTISFAGYPSGDSGSGVQVDLETGAVTGQAAGSAAAFENAIGSGFNDVLIGTTGPNVLDGGDGNDTLGGLEGNDTLRGGLGDDTLQGGAGSDNENGGDGDDLFDQEGFSNGGDVLEGGTGSDIADYHQRATGSVSVTNDNQANDGEAGEGDNVTSTVEAVVLGGAAAPIAPGAKPTQGYALVASDGGIFNFGTSTFRGSTGDITLNAPIVGIAYTSTGNGYWLVASDGGVFAFGDALHFGSMGDEPLNAPVVAIATTGDDGGYWLVASDGGIFAFGTAAARFHGSMGGKPLNAPIVGMTATPDGDGYWLVASDGGIFAFGSVADRFRGSMGGKHLNAPIVGMAAKPDGNGYWMVASDGGIFSFGSAADEFYGSAGSINLNSPIVGMAVAPGGTGYWLVAKDGGIFSYGSSKFWGSRGGAPLNRPIVGIAAVPFETAT